MERYKGYWVSGSGLPTYGYGNEWHARGAVFTVEPSGHTVDIKRFEPNEVFTEEAEAHGLELAKAWVDEHG
jgi:hypothetical protein